MEICGRSQGHAIDRIILYEESISYLEAQNLNKPESAISNPVSIKDLHITPLKIIPNPVKNLVIIQIPENFKQENYLMSIFDSAGKRWYHSETKILPYNKLEIPVHNIPSGLYWLHFRSQEQLFHEKFIKE